MPSPWPPSFLLSSQARAMDPTPRLNFGDSRAASFSILSDILLPSLFTFPPFLSRGGQCSTGASEEKPGFYRYSNIGFRSDQKGFEQDCNYRSSIAGMRVGLRLAMVLEEGRNCRLNSRSQALGIMMGLPHCYENGLSSTRLPHAASVDRRPDTEFTVSFS